MFLIDCAYREKKKRLKKNLVLDIFEFIFPCFAFEFAKHIKFLLFELRMESNYIFFYYNIRRKSMQEIRSLNWRDRINDGEKVMDVRKTKPRYEVDW